MGFPAEDTAFSRPPGIPSTACPSFTILLPGLPPNILEYQATTSGTKGLVTHIMTRGAVIGMVWSLTLFSRIFRSSGVYA